MLKDWKLIHRSKNQFNDLGNTRSMVFVTQLWTHGHYPIWYSTLYREMAIYLLFNTMSSQVMFRWTNDTLPDSLLACSIGRTYSLMVFLAVVVVLFLCTSLEVIITSSVCTPLLVITPTSLFGVRLCGVHMRHAIDKEFPPMFGQQSVD